MVTTVIFKNSGSFPISTMHRRDFFRSSAKGLTFLASGGLVSLLNRCKEKALEKQVLESYKEKTEEELLDSSKEKAPEKHPSPLINDEIGVWFYPGYMDGDRFVWNLDLMNQEYIEVLKKYDINTVYLGGVDALIYNAPAGLSNVQENMRRVRKFAQKCKKSGLRVEMVGFDDHHFLDPALRSDAQLKKRFADWIDYTDDLSNVYQIDLEPHGYDVEPPVGSHFRDNPENRKRLLKRYLYICDMFYDIAEKKKKVFAPAVPLIDTPAVAEGKGMNYDRILRDEGFGDGLNMIPAHYLILMSYTWDANELYEMGKIHMKHIKTPFALGATNFANAWDPYFESDQEFYKVPPVIDRLQEINPLLKGYLIFANVSLKHKPKHVHARWSLPADINIDREYLMKRAKGLLDKK